MINARKHTEKLFIYSMLHSVLTGCYNANPELNERTLIELIKEIKSAELDPEKSNKNMARALRLTKKLAEEMNGENGLKILLAVKHLFQDIINSGFEIFEEGEYGYQLFVELLSLIDPDKELDFEKKDKKAQKIAQQWRETLTKEGYFV